VSTDLYPLLTPPTRVAMAIHICPQSNNTRNKQTTTLKTKEQKRHSKQWFYMKMAARYVSILNFVYEFKTPGDMK
jgi:hypothetical protein